MPRKGELEEGLTYNLLRNSILFQVNKSYIKPSLWPYSVFQSSFLYYWCTQKLCTQKFASLLSIIHSETVQGHLLIYFHPSVMTAEEVSVKCHLCTAVVVEVLIDVCVCVCVCVCVRASVLNPLIAIVPKGILPQSYDNGAFGTICKVYLSRIWKCVWC